VNVQIEKILQAEQKNANEVTPEDIPRLYEGAKVRSSSWLRLAGVEY
jgi:hypothetical protein